MKIRVARDPRPWMYLLVRMRVLLASASLPEPVPGLPPALLPVQEGQLDLLEVGKSREVAHGRHGRPRGQHPLRHAVHVLGADGGDAIDVLLGALTLALSQNLMEKCLGVILAGDYFFADKKTTKNTY